MAKNDIIAGVETGDFPILNGTATLTVFPNGTSKMTNHGSPLCSMNPAIGPNGLDNEGQKLLKGRS